MAYTYFCVFLHPGWDAWTTVTVTQHHATFSVASLGVDGSDVSNQEDPLVHCLAVSHQTGSASPCGRRTNFHPSCHTAHCLLRVAHIYSGITRSLTSSVSTPSEGHQQKTRQLSCSSASFLHVLKRLTNSAEIFTKPRDSSMKTILLLSIYFINIIINLFTQCSFLHFLVRSINENPPYAIRVTFLHQVASFTAVFRLDVSSGV